VGNAHPTVYQGFVDPKMLISYDLITTEEYYLFVKLDPQQRKYDLSDKFTLSTRHENQLHRVI
jgi:hypothetical protein